MKPDLIIKNAQVVTDKEVFHGGVLVEGEKIKEIFTGDTAVDAVEVIDAEGKTLLPGIVDGHAHFNEPGREQWEGYRTGTMAAAASGITSVMEMPLNATPPTVNVDHLRHKRDVVADQAVIDYGNWGGFVDNNLEDLAAMDAEGVIGFKAFASASGVDFERVNDDMLYAGLLKMKDLGNVIGLHAENEWVCSYLGKQMRDAGRTDRAAWCESRPPFAELETVNRSCYWAKVTGGNLHVVHVSIADGIRAIDQFKKQGAHVTSETCPHYLFFDQAMFEKIGPAAKCAPPIRTRDEVEDLWSCVLDGMVDIIGSDHSPCTWDLKEKGLTDIWKAWGGVAGIQLLLPVMLSEGVNKRGLGLTDLVRMLVSNPAKMLGIYPKKGALQAGSDADFALVDLNREWTLTADQLFYKNRFSAFEGASFKGKVLQTILRGKTVYKEHRILVAPGYGQCLRRTQKYNYYS